jgi:hypothetical protein
VPQTVALKRQYNEASGWFSLRYHWHTRRSRNPGQRQHSTGTRRWKNAGALNLAGSVSPRGDRAGF